MTAPSSTIPASCHKQGLPIRSCGFALNNSVCSKRFLLCNNKPRTRRPIHTGYPQTSLNGAYFAAKQAEYETQKAFKGREGWASLQVCLSDGCDCIWFALCYQPSVHQRYRRLARLTGEWQRVLQPHSRTAVAQGVPPAATQRDPCHFGSFQLRENSAYQAAVCPFSTKQL